jgi:hypothetical protein
MVEYNAKQQIDAFKKGEYLDTFFYFYDWFCKYSSLEAKSKSLMNKAIKFAKKYNIDLENHYIWFKNNCPCEGTLYDDFRFADVTSGNTIWTVIPKSGHRNEKGAAVYGTLNDFKSAIITGDTWTEMIKKPIDLVSTED